MRRYAVFVGDRLVGVVISTLLHPPFAPGRGVLLVSLA